MISQQHRQALADAISPGLYRQYPFQVVHDEPRLHVLLSDSAAAGANCGYGYHGTKMKAMSIAIVPQVHQYAKLLVLASEYDLPNHQWGIGVEAIMYRDGNDGVGWHCDNNQNESLILCVVLKSLESRPVHIRPDGPPEEGDEEIIIFVGEGDSYSMDGEMQKHYQHCLPKKPKDPGCRNVLVFRHGMEKAVHKDSGEAVSDLALSKGINIDGVDSQSLFTLVRRVRAPPVTFGHIDSIQEGGLYSRSYLYKVS
jgi:hypothetical protein